MHPTAKGEAGVAFDVFTGGIEPGGLRSKDEIRILEPSVGAGSFIPFLFKRYEDVPHVILDVVDIDPDSVETLNIMLEKLDIPQNFTINRICQDFLTYHTTYRYDLAVGNPPFSKLKKRTPEIEISLA